jgi:PHD/YefM family antitoxin component YafN of YafNO toxin-antitoxin module
MYDSDPDVRIYNGGRPRDVILDLSAVRMFRRADSLLKLHGRVRQLMEAALTLGAFETLRFEP